MLTYILFKHVLAFITKLSPAHKMFSTFSCPEEINSGHCGNNILILVEFYSVKL